MNSFEKIGKKSKNDFFGHFGLILAMFPTSQQYDFDEITPKGP